MSCNAFKYTTEIWPEVNKQQYKLPKEILVLTAV